MKTAIIFAVAIVSLSGAAAQESQSIKNTDPYKGYVPSFAEDGACKPVRNVILMIGDGNGLAHISSAMYANRGELTLTNLKTIGFVCTQSQSDFTTDSAASGTAYATGHKTGNGRIGTDSTGTALKDMPEKLAPLGYACGVITTDDIDGATPSAFYAHQLDRNMSKEILGDLPGSELTLFAGGSIEHVNDKRPTLWNELSQAGYTIVEDLKDKKAASASKLGILPPAAQTRSLKSGRGDFLPATTAFALPWLAGKGDKGFFIMIEGARIDKSSHSNDFPTAVREVLDFDKAVEAAIRFAEADGNTLVIITADHETGGLSLSTHGDISRGEVRGYWRSDSHSPIMVPLFAYGPRSREFTGIQQNCDVSNKIFHLLCE